MNFIDLKKSRAIEASAGTGKTYTLERVVLKMLMASPHELRSGSTYLSIEDIVLVTFTDKAAGELKERIRKIIEEKIKELHALDGDLFMIEHLKTNLNLIDSAEISTIHGFCLKVLKNYAFESGSSFDLDLVDDDDGLKRELRDFLRKDSFPFQCQEWIWSELTQYLLSNEPKVLQLAGEFLQGQICVNNRIQADQLDDKVLAMQADMIAAQEAKDQWQKELSDYIFPRQEELLAACHFIETTTGSGATYEKCVTCMKAIADHISLNPGIQDWIQFLKKTSLKSPPKEMGEFKKFIQETFQEIKLGSKTKGTFKLRLDAIEARITAADTRPVLKSFAIVECAEAIAHSWMKKKNSKSQISFNDMIQRVSEALQHPKSPLLKSLRQDFRYGIIDEFQDTDALQWSIFKTIFLDSPDHVLYVVGDSKQSIYKFRGADLRTFDEALDLIEQKDQAKAHHLEFNYRSTPAMVRSYNELFSSTDEAAGFFGKINPKPYSPVKSGFNDCPQESLDKIFDKVNPWSELDYSQFLVNGHANFYVHVEGKKAAQKYRSYAQSVAKHLYQLMQDSKNTPRPIRPGDIAVLCQGKARSREIREELENLGLPCSIYKDEGVFQSKAALEWILLMEALTSPQIISKPVKRVFFTRFFHIDHEILSDQNEWSQNSQVQRALRLLDGWRKHVKSGRWGFLFDRILRESEILKRIQFKNNKLHQSGDTDRASADTHQVMEWIIDFLSCQKGSMEDLILELRAIYDEKHKVGQDQNIYTKATEKHSIKFMTMHMSKGLEFPIVINAMSSKLNFNQDGFYLIQSNPGEKSLYWDSKMLVTHVVGGEEIEESVNEAWNRESQEELARLYYVAMTRASLFQYIPVMSHRDKDTYSWPYSVFHQVAEGNYIKIPEIDPSSQLNYPVVDQGVHSNMSSNNKVKGATGLQANSEDLLSKKAGALKVIREQLVMPFQTSYSGLAHGKQQHSRSGMGAEDEHESVNSNRLGYTPEIRRQISLSTSLTPGAQTGDLLHNLFEFSTWSDLSQLDLNLYERQVSSSEKVNLSLSDTQQAFNNLLESELKKNSLWSQDEGILQQRKTEATRILVHTLSTQIVDPCPQRVDSLGISSEFRLGELIPSDVIAEMEFQFSFNQEAELFAQGQRHEMGGWIKGFMDLVFRRQIGPQEYRYYVLDWKSNALETYTRSEIHHSMLDSHYDIQAKLYQLALHEWLMDSLGSEYNPSRHLGGAIYAYVRGNRHSPNQDSFVSYPPLLEEMEQSRELFKKMLQQYSHSMKGDQ